MLLAGQEPALGAITKAATALARKDRILLIPSHERAILLAPDRIRRRAGPRRWLPEQRLKFEIRRACRPLASTLRPVIRFAQCTEDGAMHDDRIAVYRKRSQGCVRRAKLKDSLADEWARLASHWEMLARIREQMSIIAGGYDSQRDQVPNTLRA
jgi:hypothetical protein